MSVGGWTGSQHFSTAVATDAGRTTFTKAITGIATQYGLDGIDFEYGFPVRIDTTGIRFAYTSVFLAGNIPTQTVSGVTPNPRKTRRIF